MEKLYFNTGVKPWNSSKLSEYEEFINGEKHVAFYVEDIPENTTFYCACDEVNEFYLNNSCYEIRKIVGGGLSYNYAIFQVHNNFKFNTK
jgi:hypothetical protein